MAVALAWVRATHHGNLWVFDVYVYKIYTFYTTLQVYVYIFTWLEKYVCAVGRHAYRDAHVLHGQLAMYVLYYDIISECLYFNG